MKNANRYVTRQYISPPRLASLTFGGKHFTCPGLFPRKFLELTDPANCVAVFIDQYNSFRVRTNTGWWTSVSGGGLNGWRALFQYGDLSRSCGIASFSVSQSNSISIGSSSGLFADPPRPPCGALIVPGVGTPSPVGTGRLVL